MRLMTLLVVNLVWLPDTIRDIHMTYAELQHVAVRGGPGPYPVLPGRAGTGSQEPGHTLPLPIPRRPGDSPTTGTSLLPTRASPWCCSTPRCPRWTICRQR